MSTRERKAAEKGKGNGKRNQIEEGISKKKNTKTRGKSGVDRREINE